MRPYARLLSGFLTAMLAAVGVLVIAPTDAAAAEARVICNYDWVRVRSAATTSSRELGRLTRGTAVSGEQQGTWFRLVDGRFVAAYYTCAAPAAAAAPSTRVAAPSAGGATFQVCRTASVRVRERATTQSAELRRLAQGTTMTGAMQGTWLRLGDGSGYVAGYYACPDAAPAVPVPTASAPLLQPTGTLGSPTSPFGTRFHPVLRAWRLHNGIDIGNRAGEPVYAAETGIVGTVAWDPSAGLHLKIDHGTLGDTPAVGTGYLHLESVAVEVGQHVNRGQLIGRVGSTGLSTKPHLHFITYESGQPVDPEKYLGPLDSLRA